MKFKKLDIIVMGDNNLETVGGEQESTKIIIEGIEKKYLVGVIQPGLIAKPRPGVTYFNLTESTRLKHIIKNPVSFVKYVSKIKKILDLSRPSIVHTQAQVSFFIVSLLKKLNLIPKNIKIIHTERGLYTKYNSFFKKVFLFFMKELSLLVTTTNFNKKYWKKALESEKIYLEHRVIENTAGKIYENFNKKLLNKKEHFTIGFSGRYTDWKNWPLAIEISEKLNDYIAENLHVHMTVGCLDEQAEKETKKMFNAMNEILGDRFQGKINVDMKEMNLFYYDLDVFVLTSNKNTESFGRTLVEAMSRMTAVLTTDAGGSVEVVGDPSKVFETADEFVHKIIDLYEKPNLLKTEKKTKFMSC